MEGKEIPRGQRGAGRARAAGGARATHLGGQGRDGGGAAGGSWRCADAQNLPRRDEPQRSHLKWPVEQVSHWPVTGKTDIKRLRARCQFRASWRAYNPPGHGPPSAHRRRGPG